MTRRQRLAASSACLAVALLALTIEPGTADAGSPDGGIDAGGLAEGGAFPEAGPDVSVPDAAPFPEAGGGPMGPDAASFPDASGGGQSSDAGYAIADGGTPDAHVAKSCVESENPFQCEEGGPLLFEKTVELPIAFDWDTGWVPDSSPVQVRFYVKLPAKTHVRMVGSLQAQWPKPIQIVVPGSRKTGVLDFDYGLEVGAKAKIDIKILGQDVGWEGDIPYLPNVDFHVQGQKFFDPWAWKPGVTASGYTPKLTLFQVPVTEIIIPIPGISGGIELDVQGELGVTYWTDRIVVTPKGGVTGGPMAPITGPDAGTLQKWSDGAWSEYLVHPEGHVKYVGTIHLIPDFYVEILGKKLAIPLGVEYPIKIDLAEEAWTFDDQLVHVPLPNIKVADDVKGIDFGDVEIGGEKDVEIKLNNIGEEKGKIEASLKPKGNYHLLNAYSEFEAGKDTTFKVRFQPTSSGPADAILSLKTNDPDTPLIEIPLGGKGHDPMDPVTGMGGMGGKPSVAGPNPTTAPPGMDAGALAAGANTPDSAANGGCGCRVGEERGASPVAALVPLIAVLALRRRRRVRTELS